MTADPAGGRLLAVDLGLAMGLAVYGSDGRLLRYGSQRVPNRTTLRRAAARVTADAAPLAHLVTEGDVALAKIWARAAAHHGAPATAVAPERWRPVLLHPSERRSGEDAKRHADRLARAVIAWSGAARPTSLRHDAAEAILIGLWAVLELGWLREPPAELSLRRR